MKKNRKILTFILSMIIFLQSGAGIWAAEVNNSALKSEVLAEGLESERKERETDASEKSESEGSKTEDNAVDSAEPEDDELLQYIKAAKEELAGLVGKESLMALIYLCDSYSVKSTPDLDGKTVTGIPSGSMVLIKGMELDGDYNLWYQVSFEKGGTSFKGYVQREYLAYSNEQFIEWEDTYFPKMAMFASVGGYPDVEQFPASYQDKLIRLKQAHPNWIFVRQNTNLTWAKVVSEENYKDRSLIHQSMGEAYRREQHSPGWYYASEQAVEYFLDPRNFLDETRIFQFEQLTYNPSYHTQAAVQNILKNTFMKGEVPGAGMTYAQAFFQIGVSLKVSPFHLACRVYQEQGEGKSALISGTYTEVPEYKGYYNYYNIGAAGTTTKQVVESGLARAVKEGWNTHYASLKGGAGIIAESYILRGQDTLYLQKFDVDNSDGTLYTHQYMQNISAPYTESVMVRRAYVETNSIDNPFVFKIPVYNDMPASACPVPSLSTSTPTTSPTVKPTAMPTTKPTATPTVKPTATPTAKPTATPTAKPTTTPTAKPAATPTSLPVASPTAASTASPTALKPTATPMGGTLTATPTPTEKSTALPTASTASEPTSAPEMTATPMVKPTVPSSGRPTEKPTPVSSEAPASTVTPAGKPTKTADPGDSSEPTEKPNVTPSVNPENRPTDTPAVKPTAVPTQKPISTEKPAATAVPAATESPSAKAAASPTADLTASVSSTAAAATPKATSNTATAQPAQNSENSTPVNGNGQNDNQNNNQSNNGQNGEVQQTPVSTAAPTNVPEGSNIKSSANITENTSTSGITVAASTPKPHTLSEDKEIITMDMSKAGMLYAQTLQQISERGTEVVLKVGDRVSWTIDGSQIDVEEFTDINLEVTLGSSQIPKDRLALLTEGEQYVEMSLAHEGEFGFTMRLSVKLEDAEAGQYANLFYYNREDDIFEFMCASEISSSKEAVFEFKHASDYVIIISDDTKENLPAEKAEEFDQAKLQEMEAMALAREETPAKEPGKAAGIIALILLASAAIGIAVYLFTKRQDND